MNNKKYTGTVPKDYEYFTSFRIINRVWDIYINTSNIPEVIRWKVTLHDDKYFKANFWLYYSVKSQRLVRNQELERFNEEFSEEPGRMLEEISFYLVKKESRSGS